MKFQEHLSNPQFNAYFNVNSLISNFNPNMQQVKESIQLDLEDQELWSSFAQFTNEMILTKAGRRLFPLIRLSVNGLEDTALYTIQIEFKYSDNFKYRFVSGEWKTSNRTEFTNRAQQQQPPIVYEHPDSPNYGHHWSKDQITFSKLKLTNSELHNKKDLIFLKSLCKYDPIIHIYKHDRSNIECKELIFSKCFRETQFIAVTAYQNEQITKLKITHNPFAKAFLNNKPMITIENDQVITTEQPIKREIKQTIEYVQQKQNVQEIAIQNEQASKYLLQTWYQNYYPMHGQSNPPYNQQSNNSYYNAYANNYTTPHDYFYQHYYYNQYQQQAGTHYTKQENSYDYNTNASSIENSDLSITTEADRSKQSSPIYENNYQKQSNKRSFDTDNELYDRPIKKVSTSSPQPLMYNESQFYAFNNYTQRQNDQQYETESNQETELQANSSASSLALSNSSIN
jgi:hypothetical protein